MKHEHDMAGCLDCGCDAIPASSSVLCTCAGSAGERVRPSDYNGALGESIWTLLEDAPAASAQMLAWYAPKTVAALRAGDWINLNVSGVRSFRTRYSDDDAAEDDEMLAKLEANQYRRLHHGTEGTAP